jgi:hypothetical protein
MMIEKQDKVIKYLVAANEAGADMRCEISQPWESWSQKNEDGSNTKWQTVKIQVRVEGDTPTKPGTKAI